MLASKVPRSMLMAEALEMHIESRCIEGDCSLD